MTAMLWLDVDKESKGVINLILPLNQDVAGLP
jgi:hypothetical protein